MQRLADLLDMGGGRQARRAAHRAAGARRGARPTSGRSRRRAGWPPRAAAGPSWSRPTRRRCRALTRAYETGACWRCWRRWPRAYEGELANPELAIARNQKILGHRAPRTPTRSRRSSACTSRPAASPTCSPIYDKKLELAEEQGRGAGDPLQAGVASTKRRSSSRTRRSSSTSRSSPRIPSSCRRWRRSIACISSSAAGRSWRRRSRKEIDLSTDMAAVAELKFRRGAVLEQYLEDGAGAVASYREALEIDSSHVGARTALQAYLSSSDGELQRAAVKVLEPIYEANNDIARLVEVQRIKLAHEKKTDKRVDLLLRIGKLEGQLGNTDQAWEAYTRAVAERPGVDAGARGAGEPGQHPRQLAAAGRAVREGAVGEGQGAAAAGAGARAAAGRRGRLRREAGAVGAARSSTSGARRASSPRTRRRWSRWSGCTRAPSAGAIWSTRCCKKAQLVTDAGRARGDPHPHRRASGRRCWATPSRRSSPGTSCSQDNPGNVQALRALDRLYLARGEFRELADNLQRQLNLVADEPAETVAAAGAPGRAARAAPRAAGRRGRHLREDPADRARAPETDRGAGADPARARSTSWTSRMLLEPIYKIRGDWPQLIGVYEVEARHAVDPRAEDRALQADRRGLRDRAGRSGARLRGAGARAGRGSAEPRGADERRAPGARAAQAGRSGRAATGGWSASVADPERKNALYHKIARLAEADLGDDAQAAAAYLAALDVWPRDLEAANALEQLYLRRADYPNLVKLLLAQGGDRRRRRREEDALLPGGAALRRGARGSRRARSACSSTCCRSTTATRRRSISWSGCTSGSRAGTTSRTSTPRRRSWRPTPAEKKQMLFVLGQVYDRELGDPERAVETYSSIMDLDPEDYDAAQALDRLYQQLGRWYDLLAVLERQTELAPSPAEVVSLRYRIGELWREHLKDLGARRRGLPRRCWRWIRRTSRRSRALEALMTGKDEPVLAAAVLEPIYESAGEWDRVIAVYEVMAGEQRRRRPHRRAAVADRRDRGAAAVAPERGVRRLRPRAARRSEQPGRARAPRAAGRSRPGTGPSWPTLLASEIEKVDEPRRAIDLLLRLARVYEEETGQVGGGDRDLPARDRRRSRQQARRWSRSTGCTGAPSSGTSWPTIVRREIRVAPTDEDRVALTFRLAQIYELALVDMPKAVEAYREILTADPTHAETRAALERMFIGGTMQLEIADVLEPLYRHGRGVGEAAPDPRGAARPADRRRRAAGAAAPAGRDRRAEAGRSGRGVRLVGAGGQGGSVVGAGARRAAAPGARDAPVGRVRHHDDRARRRPIARRPCGATCCCGWPPASRTTSATWNAPRRRWCRCWREHEKDPAALASLDRIYESQGMYENLAGDPAPAHLTITDDTDELVAAEPAARARLRRGAGGGRSARSPATWRCWSTSRARARRWTRSSGSTSAASAGRSCTASTRSWSTSPATRRAWPTATRAWPSWPPTRSTIATRPSSCGAASSTSAARTPIALSGLADLHEMAGRVEAS